MNKKITIGVGWALIALIVFTLIAFAIQRSVDTYSGVSHENLFELRYLEHPVITALHMLSGILFITLAPLQFMAKVRTKNLGRHRKLGRILVMCALVSGIYGLIATVSFPAFGGLASETSAWFFGLIFLFAILRAFWCARNRNISQHREWMIRAFALGLGVGSQRLILIIMLVSTDYGFDQSFGPALWLGFGLNLLIAETWINISRKAK